MTLSSLSRHLYERFPYPIGWCWSRAKESTTPQGVHRAAEAILKMITALVASDVMDLKWPAATEKWLVEGPEGRGLDRLAFGHRVDLLRRLIPIHHGAKDRILPDLSMWWREAGSALDELVRERNLDAHGPRVSERSPVDAQNRLAELLRASSWLASVQVLHVDGPVQMMKRRLHGRVRLLRGIAPYADLASEASWSIAFEASHVYIGSADGQRWSLAPFLSLGTSGGAEGRSTRLMVFDGVERDGRVRFTDPASTGDSATAAIEGLPDTNLDLVPWRGFFELRRESAASWRMTEPRPSPALVLPASTDCLSTILPGLCIDDYRFVQLLGEGSTASVWEVEDVHTHQRWALKILKQESVENEEAEFRFREEATQFKRLYAVGCRHLLGPVDTFHFAVDSRKRLVLRMPLMRGSARDWCSEMRDAGTPLDEARVRLWARNALEALTDLHACGVVHRDVKPSNLLVTEAGELVLADLGVARVDGGRELTQTGDSLGTSVYMAQEQRVDPRSVTGKADVYSLAVTLSDLWTGRSSGVVARSLSGPFAELLRKMASVDPEERPDSASALQELEQIEGTGSSPSTLKPSLPRPAPAEPWPRPQKGTQVAWYLVTIAMVLLLGFLVSVFLAMEGAGVIGALGLVLTLLLAFANPFASRLWRGGQPNEWLHGRYFVFCCIGGLALVFYHYWDFVTSIESSLLPIRFYAPITSAIEENRALTFTRSIAGLLNSAALDAAFLSLLSMTILLSFALFPKSVGRSPFTALHWSVIPAGLGLMGLGWLFFGDQIRTGGPLVAVMAANWVFTAAVVLRSARATAPWRTNGFASLSFGIIANLAMTLSLGVLSFVQAFITIAYVSGGEKQSLMLTAWRQALESVSLTWAILGVLYLLLIVVCRQGILLSSGTKGARGFALSASLASAILVTAMPLAIISPSYEGILKLGAAPIHGMVPVTRSTDEDPSLYMDASPATLEASSSRLCRGLTGKEAPEPCSTDDLLAVLLTTSECKEILANSVKGSSPALCLTAPQARLACEAVGKRLPSSAEWADALADSFPKLTVPSGRQSSPVRMAIAEWTEDKVGPRSSFAIAGADIIPGLNQDHPPERPSPLVGFRCVYRNEEQGLPKGLFALPEDRSVTPVNSPIMSRWLEPLSTLSPASEGEERYRQVPQTEEVPATLLEGIDQAIAELVMIPNMQASGMEAIGLDPRKWDQKFRESIARSVKAHSSSRSFWRRLEEIADDYASVVQALRDEGLPEVFAAIPYMESTYHSKAQSTACARGYWQLMPETALRYGVEIEGCQIKNTDELWTPTRTTVPRSLAQVEYMRDGRCQILSCQKDGRVDLAASTRAAIASLKEPMNDPGFRASGSLIQLVITSYNAGYWDEKLDDVPREHNIRPALETYLDTHPGATGMDFLGDNLLCPSVTFTTDRCGSLLNDQAQHYAYNVVAQHILSVCYYARNHSTNPVFKPWAKYDRGAGYCTAASIPDALSLSKP